ncbi:MAG: serine/threonine-protein kinase [Myxococcota bacterium]
MNTTDSPDSDRSALDEAERSSSSGTVPADPRDSSGSGLAEQELVRASVMSRLFSAHETEAPRIGRFVVLRRLGEWGMGIVYAAYDEKLDRRVAIKVLRRELDASARGRILREAKAMATISHPNVVPVFEIGEHGEDLFIVMEFLPGQPLDRWQQQPERSEAEVLAAYVLAGRGLACAHGHGLIHRDFKPHNVMAQTAEDGQLGVRVLDFGLARRAEELPSVERPRPKPPDETTSASDRMTATGAILGTPAYMAPEQFTSASVGAAADQFSFCVALWEGLYGTRPFVGHTVAELRDAITAGLTTSPPRRATLPVEVGVALERGLQVDPDARHASMNALLIALTPEEPTRRWPLVVAGLAVLGVGGAGLIAWQQARAERCSGAPEQMTGVWDAERRAEVESSMLGIDNEYAQVAWSRSSAELDAYAEAWTGMFTEVCEATTIRREQSTEAMDLRMTCLHTARRELATVTEVLSDADAKAVQKVDELLGTLAPLERCADLDALGRDVPPPSAAEAEMVERVRELLAEAEAQRKVGRIDRAAERLSEAQALAEGVEYEPLRSELDLERGEVLDLQGDYEQSEQALEDALKRATRWDQREIMERAARGLISVIGDAQRKPEQALRYREVAEGLAEGDPLREAAVRLNLATVLRRHDALTEAETQIRRALELREGALGPDDPAVAVARNNLALIVRSQGKQADAKQLLRQVLETRKRTLGSDHPDVGQSYNNLATSLAMGGALDEALPLFEQALDVWERSLGPDHPLVAGVLHNLGMTQRRLKDPSAAESRLRRALEIRERTLEPTHPAIASTRGELANVYGDNGDFVRAERELQLALTMTEQRLGPDHSRVGIRLNQLAEIHLQQGRFEDCERDSRRTLEIFEATLGPEHVNMAKARLMLGRALLSRGEHTEAGRELAQARTLAQKVLDPADPALAEAHTLEAMALLAGGDPESARPLAERAWSNLQQGSADPVQRAEAALVLARALWAASDDDAHLRAIEVARAGIVGDTSKAPELAKSHAQLSAWLRDKEQQ